ncbi:MAG TPA: hypothetical protein VJ867_06925 [Gemmatimonadaceae bacterium]|nr:hypothetical protein [Gemmatimonadaceae bacterium]
MRTIAILALVALVACLDATDVDDLLTLSLVADKQSIGTNDTVHLTITLANHSGDDLTLTTPPCRPYFFALDTLGRQITPSQTVCTTTPPAIILPAHDSVQFAQYWSGEGRTTTGDTLRVAPGTYHLIALLYGTHTRLESRSVQVEVLP